MLEVKNLQVRAEGKDILRGIDLEVGAGPQVLDLKHVYRVLIRTVVARQPQRHKVTKTHKGM